MKKEYYYLIGGVFAGALIGYFYAKNQFETTSGFMESGDHQVRPKAHLRCVAKCMREHPLWTVEQCIAACGG